jgi:fructokinase
MTGAAEPRPAARAGLVLVAGEALYDLVLAGGDDDLRGHPGGGPFNTARTIARLEQPVAFLGRLSTDRFGTRLERLLAHDGVRLDAVVRADDPTTLALAEIGEDGSAVYRFYADGTSAAGLTVDAALAAIPPGVGLLHVGTLGLVLEPMASALVAVVEVLAGRALIMVDPNCRPWVIGDASRYRARLRRVLGHSHVVKVSEEDLDWLYPGESRIAAAQALLAQGPSVALLTRGGDGALVVTPDEAFPVPAPAARVIDTIGAGDAFGGGFAAWWHGRGLGPDELADRELLLAAVEFGCRVAARTCERAGAQPPRAAELIPSPAD